MQDLTKAEENIMQCVWKLGNNIQTSEIMQCLKEDFGKEYINSTLCVFMSYLRKKGYVSFQKKGNAYVYSPLITRDEYAREKLLLLLNGCFEGSLPSLFEIMLKDAGKEEKKKIVRVLEEYIQEI